MQIILTFFEIKFSDFRILISRDSKIAGQTYNFADFEFLFKVE